MRKFPVSPFTCAASLANVIYFWSPRQAAQSALGIKFDMSRCIYGKLDQLHVRTSSCSVSLAQPRLLHHLTSGTPATSRPLPTRLHVSGWYAVLRKAKLTNRALTVLDVAGEDPCSWNTSVSLPDRVKSGCQNSVRISQPHQKSRVVQKLNFTTK